MDSVLRLLGLARRAGRLEAGEQPVGAAARAHRAKLILLSAGATDNSARRAAQFAQAGQVPLLEIPFSKEQLGLAIGRGCCSMLAVTDAGFASALAEKLAEQNPASFGPDAARLKEAAAGGHRQEGKNTRTPAAGRPASRRKVGAKQTHRHSASASRGKP